MNKDRKYFGKDLEALSFAQNYHKWVLEEFIPYLGDRVAEVGGGTGNFSEFLLSTDIKELMVFEPSVNMFTLLEKKFAQKSNVQTINAFLEDRSYQHRDTIDSVCYVNVLEHIKDDRAALFHAHQILRRKGHILIFAPALPFLYSEFDKMVGHYRRYAKKELIEIVTSAGFSIKKVKYFDIAGIIPWYIAFVLLKRSTTDFNVSLYDKLIVPFMRKIEALITPIIGKSLIVVGQKE